MVEKGNTKPAIVRLVSCFLMALRCEMHPNEPYCLQATKLYTIRVTALSKTFAIYNKASGWKFDELLNAV